EKTGSFVNVEWRVQRFTPPLPPPRPVRAGGDVLAGLPPPLDPGAARPPPAQGFAPPAAAVPALPRFGPPRPPAARPPPPPRAAPRAPGAPLPAPQAEPAPRPPHEPVSEVG